MIRITRDPIFGYNVTAPGQPAVWCGTREVAAQIAWSLAERLAPMGRGAAVCARPMLADSLAALARAGAELAEAVQNLSQSLETARA